MAHADDMLRVEVTGADPSHAEREARELRDLLRQLDGVDARFAHAAGAGQATDGAKGPLLSPEVVLLVAGGALGVVRTAIKGWVEVRKSRGARIEHPDGTVLELRGGVSGRELKKLRDQDRPDGDASRGEAR
ncbi:effector-associated constant component EACC1 [Streptomyces violens]|uniref:effector-associated constant component EACC1 n=1 Tax=Streptomyces violens TaxID=66377 RepID=UPI001470004F|nr:hypothetical protein [Streptomyces violens]